MLHYYCAIIMMGILWAPQKQYEIKYILQIEHSIGKTKMIAESGLTFPFPAKCIFVYCKSNVKCVGFQKYTRTLQKLLTRTFSNAKTVTCLVFYAFLF